MKVLERFIAVDNACLWPQLRIGDSGDIFMTGFNKPCHGMIEGDVDLWKSSDGGRLFNLASTPVVHAPGENRMNHVSGFAHNDDFMAIVSGYTNRPTIIYDYDYYKENYFIKSELVVPMVARSKDGGPSALADRFRYIFENESIIPYGEIIRLGGSMLMASLYVLGTNKAAEFSTCTRRAGVLLSYDDGATWTQFYEIDKGINETSILALDDNSLLASCRTATQQRMKLYKSNDGGKTWAFLEDSSLLHQIPSSLINLSGYYNCPLSRVRNNQKSIMYRVGDVNGENWTEPNILVVLDGAAL